MCEVTDILIVTKSHNIHGSCVITCERVAMTVKPQLLKSNNRRQTGILIDIFCHAHKELLIITMDGIKMRQLLNGLFRTILVTERSLEHAVIDTDGTVKLFLYPLTVSTTDERIVLYLESQLPWLTTIALLLNLIWQFLCNLTMIVQDIIILNLLLDLTVQVLELLLQSREVIGLWPTLLQDLFKILYLFLF